MKKYVKMATNRLFTEGEVTKLGGEIASAQ